MRESGRRRTGRHLGATLACLVASSPAAAKCSPLLPGTTVELPSSLTLACGTARCRVSAAGRPLAEVALAGKPNVCDTTNLHVEEGLPETCDHALSRTGLSLRQEIPSKGGPLSSQVVVDVLGEAPGIPWVGARGPIKACLPRYAGKRGDVWQYTWRGEGGMTVYQVFEEDEAMAGRGSGKAGQAKPPPLVLSVTGTSAARAPAVTHAAKGVAGHANAPEPRDRPTSPDVTRF